MIVNHCEQAGTQLQVSYVNQRSDKITTTGFATRDLVV